MVIIRYWLIKRNNMSRKGYDRVLWPFVFLNMKFFFFFCVWLVLVPLESMASPGCQCSPY